MNNTKNKKHVAQWIERQIPILKVKGSIPLMLNKQKYFFLNIDGAD